MVRALGLLIGLLLIWRSATAEDWPEFRGPGGQGHADATALPLRWDLQTDVRWRVPLPGKGWSSPVVQDGRIFLTTAVPIPGSSPSGQSLRALALDAATGDILWNVEVFAKTLAADETIHPKNSFASSTPITDGQYLYVHFGPDGTACLDLEGQRIWDNDRLPYDSVYGAGGSPVFAGSLLVFSSDGAEDPFVAALDRSSGAVAWRTARPPMPSPRWSFATPLVIQAEGRRQIVCPAANMVCSYDLETGEELWRVRYPNRWSIVPRPVFAEGLVFVTTGYTGPPALLAIRPTGSGDVTDSHVVWRTDSHVPHTPSLLVVGQELFMVSDRGIVSCRDVRTGSLHWQHRVGGNFSASPIHAAGRIYMISEEGVCTVIAAAREYQELARNDLQERTLASFAVTGQSLLVRTDEHLYRIESAGRDGN
jgi:outer membrane protein assembly factor BamB